MKTFTLRIPVSIEEDGAPAVSSHFEIRAKVPDEATIEDALEAFAFQFAAAMQIAAEKSP